MRHWFARSVTCAAALGIAAALVFAQQPRPGGLGRPPDKDNRQQEAQAEEPPRPTDPRLLALHKDFVQKAEKLASDLEKQRQFDKAQEVYEAILRLVPKYPAAEEGLNKMMQLQATADRKVMDVMANKGWQDTGVNLIAGKPVVIEAKGTWTFRLSSEISAAGMEIPKELRDFAIGALVGVIVQGNSKDFKPFLVGAKKEFEAPQSGRLLLRMYDYNPDDNEGKLSVTIQSTFAKE
jgi:hypothetical protein